MELSSKLKSQSRTVKDYWLFAPGTLIQIKIRLRPRSMPQGRLSPPGHNFSPGLIDLKARRTICLDSQIIGIRAKRLTFSQENSHERQDIATGCHG
jgi:hypothetical protein